VFLVDIITGGTNWQISERFTVLNNETAKRASYQIKRTQSLTDGRKSLSKLA